MDEESRARIAQKREEAIQKRREKQAHRSQSQQYSHTISPLQNNQHIQSAHTMRGDFASSTAGKAQLRYVGDRPAAPAAAAAKKPRYENHGVTDQQPQRPPPPAMQQQHNVRRHPEPQPSVKQPRSDAELSEIAVLRRELKSQTEQHAEEVKALKQRCLQSEAKAAVAELSEIAVLRRELKLQAEQHAEEVKALKQRCLESEAKAAVAEVEREERRDAPGDDMYDAVVDDGESHLAREVLIEEELKCKICHDACADPHMLACGHMYCFGCIVSWIRTPDLKTKVQTCPECRTKILELPIPFLDGDKLCQRLASKLPAEEKKDYLGRRAQNLQARDEGQRALEEALAFRKGEDRDQLELPPAVAAAAAAGAAAWEVAEQRQRGSSIRGPGDMCVTAGYGKKGKVENCAHCKKKIKAGEAMMGVPKTTPIKLGMTKTTIEPYHLECYVFHVGLHQERVTVDRIKGLDKMEQKEQEFLRFHAWPTEKPAKGHSIQEKGSA